MKTMKNFRRAMLLMALCATCYLGAKATNVTNDNNEEDDPYKEFVSPQWGMKCPKGYIRLTEYKKLAETDATASKQYYKLQNTMNKAKAKRQKLMKKQLKKVTTRTIEVEEKAQKYANRLFKRANIEMMNLGAYRLPDGTIVIEDDKSEISFVKTLVQWQEGTDSEVGRPYNQAPTMERDMSPNYSAYNEQTWPVYTDVETVSWEEYHEADDKPQVYRGKDCTYVVGYNRIYFHYHWFHPSSESKLVDPETNTQYMIRQMEHFPLNKYYWIHNMNNKLIKRVSIYPPLPEHVKTVDLIPGKIPVRERLDNVAPYKEYRNLEVKTLPTGKVIY